MQQNDVWFSSCFQATGIALQHVESRSSTPSSPEIDVLVQFESSRDAAINLLKMIKQSDVISHTKVLHDKEKKTGAIQNLIRAKSEIQVLWKKSFISIFCWHGLYFEYILQINPKVFIQHCIQCKYCRQLF